MTDKPTRAELVNVYREYLATLRVTSTVDPEFNKPLELFVDVEDVLRLIGLAIPDRMVSDEPVAHDPLSYGKLSQWAIDMFKREKSLRVCRALAKAGGAE